MRRPALRTGCLVLLGAGAASVPATVTHDVLVLYSADAREEAGGTGQMLERIDRVFAEANRVYENSRVDVRLRLVGTREVGRNPDGTDPVAARAHFMHDPHGEYGDVRALRDSVRADIVSLWGKDIAYGGLSPAWVGDRADASLGYHIVDAELAEETYSFLHEVGHNQGCYHDVTTDGPSPGAPDHAYGWRLEGVRGLTIMAKGPAGFTRIPHFSNPDVSYRGEPTGAVGLPGGDPRGSYGADCARRIRETADIVAAWR